MHSAGCSSSQCISRSFSTTICYGLIVQCYSRLVCLNHLVVVLWRAVESSGGGTLPEKVTYWQQASTLFVFLHFLSLWIPESRWNVSSLSPATATMASLWTVQQNKTFSPEIAFVPAPCHNSRKSNDYANSSLLFLFLSLWQAPLYPPSLWPAGVMNLM